MTTTTTHTLNELVEWYQNQTNDLLHCDPSFNEDSQARYFEIQKEGQELEDAIKASGFTIEQVEDAADF